MKIIGSRRGAGLIDVMLTLFLLGVAGMIFASVFPTSIRASKQAQEYKVATAIAQKKMEQMRAMNYESLYQTQLQLANVIDQSPTSSPYSFTAIDDLASQLTSGTGTITIIDPDSTSKQVTVKIEWAGQSNTKRSIELITIFADRRTRKAI